MLPPLRAAAMTQLPTLVHHFPGHNPRRNAARLAVAYMTYRYPFACFRKMCVPPNRLKMLAAAITTHHVSQRAFHRAISTPGTPPGIISIARSTIRGCTTAAYTLMPIPAIPIVIASAPIIRLRTRIPAITLTDARKRCRNPKLIYPTHRLTPRPNGDATGDC